MYKHDIRNDSLLTNVYFTVASLSGELCSICFRTAVVVVVDTSVTIAKYGSVSHEWLLLADYRRYYVPSKDQGCHDFWAARAGSVHIP